MRGDLDQILLKAIDLDPAQRYASADALARDLERYLADEAPQAIAPERSERGAACCSAIRWALLPPRWPCVRWWPPAGAALWHARAADQARAVAEQRAAQASRPASGMLAEVNDALGKTPAAARGKFVGSAAAYLGQLADVRRAAGDLPGAQQAASLAHGLAEKQAQANSDDLRWRRQLSATGGQVGAILVEQGKTAEGLVELRKALAMREELAAKDVGNYAAARDVADAHASIAAAMMATMDYVPAEKEMTIARNAYAAQLRANPADASLRTGLIELELARANVQNLQHHGRDAVQTLAALHALADEANREPVDAHVAARIALLDAHIQPRGTPAKAYAAAELALAELLKQTEKDRLDTYQLRESALAWQQTGEIGQRAGQTESACRYLGLAAKRYEEFDASQRLNAIDKLRQGQVQALRKACG